MNRLYYVMSVPEWHTLDFVCSADKGKLLDYLDHRTHLLITGLIGNPRADVNIRVFVWNLRRGETAS
jgi:hypothetical protein